MNYFKIWASVDTTIKEWVKQLNRLIENGNFQNVNLSESGSFYFGDKNTDGTWRITRDGNNLIHQRRELGAWVTKTIVQSNGTSNQSTLKTIRQTFQGVNINIKFSTIIKL